MRLVSVFSVSLLFFNLVAESSFSWFLCCSGKKAKSWLWKSICLASRSILKDSFSCKVAACCIFSITCFCASLNAVHNSWKWRFWSGLRSKFLNGSFFTIDGKKDHSNCTSFTISGNKGILDCVACPLAKTPLPVTAKQENAITETTNLFFNFILYNFSR